MTTYADGTSVHPRPQLVRDRWIDLCGEWQFAFDDDDCGLAGRWYDDEAAFDRMIMVPYPPESKLSGVADSSYHPVVWYRRSFDPPRLAAGERLLLHFGAIDYGATVWLNGQHIIDHEGGHTPFTADVTQALDREVNGHNVVVVRAEDRPTDMTQPRGKQDWLPEPHGIWYHRTTGIWQPVWLEPVPEVHVAELQWTPDIADSRVGLRVRLNRTPSSSTTLRIRLTCQGEMLTELQVRVTDETSRCEIAIPELAAGVKGKRLLWSPEHPTLVEADLQVLAGGTVLDTVGSYLGLRSVGFADGRFLLNARPYYLRMVLEQGYWPESHLAAPDADALRREVELIKELGFNGTRIHQKVEDPRFLYWCDRLGLLVWGEMANAREFSPDAVERLVGEWQAVVRRDRNHPCVVTWVPLNESWGVNDIATEQPQQDYAISLYHLTRALDPSRPVISNDGWEHTESDIWGVHDYAPTGESLRDRYGDRERLWQTLRGAGPQRHRLLLGDPVYHGQPVMITEFGGLSYTPSSGEDWFGYATVETAEQLLSRIEDLIGAVLDSPEIAGFCYTQLTDTLQERNGLLTEARVPKIPVTEIRRVLNRPSRAVPAEELEASQRAARRSRDRAAQHDPNP